MHNNWSTNKVNTPFERDGTLTKRIEFGTTKNPEKSEKATNQLVKANVVVNSNFKSIVKNNDIRNMAVVMKEKIENKHPSTNISFIQNRFCETQVRITERSPPINSLVQSKLLKNSPQLLSNSSSPNNFNPSSFLGYLAARPIKRYYLPLPQNCKSLVSTPRETNIRRRNKSISNVSSKRDILLHSRRRARCITMRSSRFYKGVKKMKKSYGLSEKKKSRVWRGCLSKSGYD